MLQVLKLSIWAQVDLSKNLHNMIHVFETQQLLAGRYTQNQASNMNRNKNKKIKMKNKNNNKKNNKKN